jgi:hypothetical protein
MRYKWQLMRLQTRVSHRRRKQISGVIENAVHIENTSMGGDEADETWAPDRPSFRSSIEGPGPLATKEQLFETSVCQAPINHTAVHGDVPVANAQRCVCECEAVANSTFVREAFHGNDTSPNLPPYLTPLPRSLDSETMHFLATKDTFSLPSTEFRDICLSRYIEFVHPLLPVLNLNNFLMTIERGTGEGGTISLSLFHAVLCSALSFVEEDVCTKAGYSSKREARQAFLDKTKVYITIICSRSPS